MGYGLYDLEDYLGKYAEVVDLDGDGEPDHVVMDPEDAVEEILDMVEEGELEPEEAEDLLDLIDAQLEEDDDIEEKTASISIPLSFGVGLGSRRLFRKLRYRIKPRINKHKILQGLGVRKTPVRKFDLGRVLEGLGFRLRRKKSFTKRVLRNIRNLRKKVKKSDIERLVNVGKRVAGTTARFAGITAKKTYNVAKSIDWSRLGNLVRRRKRRNYKDIAVPLAALGIAGAGLAYGAYRYANPKDYEIEEEPKTSAT